MTDYLPPAIIAALVIGAASTGALFTPGPWYEQLAKPSWTPPNWLFPVAWTVLYAMIAYAGYRVWSIEGIGPATIVWAIGLAFNAAWSWIMFGEHKIGMALADLTLMWLSIAAFIVLAWPIDRTAAYLFMPYFAWATFAGALNYEVWRLNS
ncbi:MAG: TspO/MBR family protein [Hyphomicrobium sp.]|nr:TspO/MBR family protein [Hyphomicrobium sp.]